MRTLASLLVLAAAPALAAAQASKEDLKKLAKAGVSEDVIVAYLKANGFDGKPSSDDLVELKDAGLSDRVLTSLLSPAPATPNLDAPARTEAAPPTTVYVQPTTTVYPSGYWSVGGGYSYSSSYCAPSNRYYGGSYYRPSYSYYRPYYGSYYRSSSYCSPRLSFSFSSNRHHRSGFSSRVRW